MKHNRTGALKTNIITILLCLTAITVLANNGETHEPSMTHRMMILAFQLGSILLAGKLVGIIFEKIKIPGVIGEISAGILIGPYMMGCLPLPGLPEGLFPPNGSFPVSPELYGFCSIAAIVLLSCRLTRRNRRSPGIICYRGSFRCVIFRYAFWTSCRIHVRASAFPWHNINRNISRHISANIIRKTQT